MTTPVPRQPLGPTDLHWLAKTARDMEAKGLRGAWADVHRDCVTTLAEAHLYLFSAAGYPQPPTFQSTAA